MTVPEPVDLGVVLAQGLEHHQAGRLAQADAAYCAVLAGLPGQPDALHLLAVLKLQQGQLIEGDALRGWL